MKVKDIIQKLEKDYSKDLAYDFDNPGLNVGKCNTEVKGILVCLDVTNDVIDFAIKNNINFILSHHPMLFYKMQNVNENRIDTKKVMRLLENKISIYSMHTNFDVRKSIGMGDIVSDKLFKKLEIKKASYIEMVDKVNGLGKNIVLNKKVSINDILERLIKNINIDKNMLRVYTKSKTNDKYITKISILPGSGKSDVDKIIDFKADVYLSGDLSHNNILDLLDENISYIDCTHYGLEKVFIDFMYDRLKKIYKNTKILKVYNEYI